MRGRTGDLVAAPIVALWALVVLPGWKAAGHLMTTNSMLLFVDAIVGMVLLAAVVLVTFTALGLAVGLVAGWERARLQALILGAVTGLGGLSYAIVGQMSTLTDSRWALGTWLLAALGGPLVVALIVAGGELLPPPRRRTPAPPSLSATPAPAPPAPTTLLTGGAQDYWTQVANRPAPHPSELPDPPFWEDLSPMGWVVFGALASAVILGALWIGGRWHRGSHPIAGVLLVATAIGVAAMIDRARRRSTRR